MKSRLNFGPPRARWCIVTKQWALQCGKMQGKQGCGLTNRPVVTAGGGGGTALERKWNGCALLPGKQTRTEHF